MTAHPAFDLVETRELPELASTAHYYRHKKTGAEVLSLVNEDENKVFGITFKTLPEDSTGVAHILEHSVLCGSKAYPAKKPFVEMMKGSLQTFLNAMTFPDKTVYPVASQNLQDFYNLVGVYLDAVLNPILAPETFLQEGWHFELEAPDAPLSYKGVVFNEMKGAYSSPDTILNQAVMQATMPDTIYANSSGGDPKVMPTLTYDAFLAFHKRYYHPSNARVMFTGDDDPAERLEILDKAFSDFDKAEPANDVELQPKFDAPKKVVTTYSASAEDGPARDGRIVLNWLLDEPTSEQDALALSVLGYILTGTAAAPLKKALNDSDIGESVIGSIALGTRQPLASYGLKGVDPERADEVETLVMGELKRLVEDGIEKGAIEAAINTLEFHLRELNTGSFPRGIALMFGVLNRWLHGADPVQSLAFEEPLNDLKKAIEAEPRLFEELIASVFLNNAHRTTVVLRADPDQAQRESAEERARLDAVQSIMEPQHIEMTIAETRRLRALQEAIDTPEALASIPKLELSDLPRENQSVPTEKTELSGITTLYHDLPTNGIVYVDIGFNLRSLPADHLPLVPLFSQALLQTGTHAQDFVSLTQRIGRSTGGIYVSRLTMPVYESDKAAAWVMMRGKAVADNTTEMLAIMGDVLLDANLDNPTRIRQMVREAKAGIEARLAPAGHQFASMRLEAGMNEAGLINEQMGGITHLFFLRELEKQIEDNWPAVLAGLESIRDHLLTREGIIANVTTDADNWEEFAPKLGSFMDGLPKGAKPDADWRGGDLPKAEAFSFPSQVNFVAEGLDIEKAGYARNGVAAVAVQHLNTTYMWDKIRVQGGAYGGFSGYSGASGIFRFGSYRDPNLLQTLDVYAGAAEFLRKPLSRDDFDKTIIGVIGSMDRYMLPDAKGYTEFTRYLAGESSETRQKIREQVLDATPEDFGPLADAIEAAANDARIVVLGSEETIGSANAERGNFLSVTRIM